MCWDAFEQSEIRLQRPTPGKASNTRTILPKSLDITQINQTVDADRGSICLPVTVHTVSVLNSLIARTFCLCVGRKGDIKGKSRHSAYKGLDSQGWTSDKRL